MACFLWRQWRYGGVLFSCYSSSYNYDYGPNPIQEASHYSSTHESGESDLIEYKPCAYYRDDFSVNPLELNYSVYTYSEPEIVHYDPTEYPSYSYYESYLNTSETNYVQPKFLQYEPPPDDRGYFPVETHFTVSYSNHEFNAPEFEEYDPTPYGGGYDLVTTYGKPLPPSDNICYPRTHPHSGNNKAPPYSSIPSPYGKEDHLPTKPPDVNVSTPHVGNGDKVSDDGKEDKNVETDMIPTITDSPSSEHQQGLFDNGRRDVEREVTQFPPYGSGLEAMDLCEEYIWLLALLSQAAEEQRMSSL